MARDKLEENEAHHKKLVAVSRRIP